MAGADPAAPNREDDYLRELLPVGAGRDGRSALGQGHVVPIRSTSNVNGQSGYFKRSMNVYGRADQKLPQVRLGDSAGENS